MNLNFEPQWKQHLLFQAFDDPNILQILFGGAAGGGKTYAVCSLAVIKCIQYPGIAVAFARNSMKTLKDNTYGTFKEIFRHREMENNKDYYYNQHQARITFRNGSYIQFISLKYFPSDPDYDELGGSMYTFSCIEEAGNIHEKGYEYIVSRTGRNRNDEYNIPPKLIITCNPSTNWINKRFYTPWTKGELEPWKVFIPSTLKDNKKMDKGYVNMLNTLTGANRARLLRGEWLFDDEKERLIPRDTVMALYRNYNNPLYIPQGKYYLSVDMAFSSDKCIIILWKGLDIIKIINYKDPEKKPHKLMAQLMNEYNIDPRNVVYDADGPGSYLQGEFKHSYHFNNGGKVLLEEKYDHLKSQCYFKLAEQINLGKINVLDANLKEELIEEVFEIKSQPLDTLDSKLKIIKKEDVKSIIGRSPDISDAMMMRMVWEIKPKNTAKPSVKFF